MLWLYTRRAAALGCLRQIPAHAADSAAGQKIFAGTCAACHQLQETMRANRKPSYETQIKGIVAGTVKHPKKLTLSADDIANVATYIASNEPK